MKIFCDSSTTEACVFLEGQEPKLLKYKSKVTVNVGEYRAVLFALRFAGVGDMILTDSYLVVMQAQKSWACRKPHLLPFRDKVRQLLQDKYCMLEWIPREENLAGKVLEGRVKK